MKKGTNSKFVLLLIVSAILSWIIANTIDTTHMELGALVNVFFPLLFGITSIVIYSITTHFFKNATMVKNLFILLFLLNIGFGVYIRIVTG